MTLDPSQLVTASMGMLCGIGLYLALVNRVLSHLRDGVLKSSFLPLALLVCVGGMTTFGFLVARSTWSATLAVILVWMLVAEVRMRTRQRLLRSDPPNSSTRRRFSLIHPITTQDLQVDQYRLALPSWQGSQLRIAHLSDLHLHTGSPLAFFRRVVQQVNACSPDLIFITGDFAADLHGIAELPEILQPLSSRLGKFAILGNHDYWTDPGHITAAVSQAGFILLGDSQVHPLQTEAGSLALSGCSVPWSKESCLPLGVPAGSPLLVLAHTADSIYAFSRLGVTAVFSGHYHAGQIQLPYFGPLVVPSRYGRVFYQGHFKVNDTHLFVSAGTGASHPPLRLYCPPDIIIVDLLGNRFSLSVK